MQFSAMAWERKLCFARVCHLVGEKEIVWLCVCFCSRTNVRTDYTPTYRTGSKFCYTLAAPYLWASFHCPIPSLSDIRKKVRKFYQIWVWNAETQHLMHKVRGNYSSCISLSTTHICRVTTTNECKQRNLHNVCHQVSVFGYEGSCIQEEYIWQHRVSTKGRNLL
jgi:hypothetical protein